MRFLFWLLVLLNLGALVYFNLDFIAPAPVSNVKADLNPEKLKLLTPQELEAMPKRQSAAAEPLPVASNEPTACYEWGSFEAEKLSDALAVLNALSIKNSVVQQTNGENTKYWVYKPPLPSDAAAEAKANELRALGITEFFVVKDSKWRNAISFGIFRDEQLATNLMNDLRHRGVREVVKSVRNQSGNTTLMLEDVSTTLIEQLKKNQPDFPDTEIKDTLCPTA